MRPAAFCSFLLIFLHFCSAQQSQNKGYYRYPTIYHDSVVFTAEGDLWQVSIEGGLATRLTSSPGEEKSAAFSPDGRTPAFTADYEGPSEVYAMPVSLGIPQRRTFDGQAIVEGWTAAAGSPLPFQHLMGSLRYASTESIPAKQFPSRPIATSFAADWSSDGKWIYFLSDRALNTVVKSPWAIDSLFHSSIVQTRCRRSVSRRVRFSPFEPADELKG